MKSEWVPSMAAAGTDAAEPETTEHTVPALWTQVPRDTWDWTCPWHSPSSTKPHSLGTLVRNNLYPVPNDSQMPRQNMKTWGARVRPWRQGAFPAANLGSTSPALGHPEPHVQEQAPSPTGCGLTLRNQTKLRAGRGFRGGVKARQA